MNIRSLSKNFDAMIDFFTTLDNPFTVVCLSEVWLTSTDLNLYAIPEYSAEFCCRDDNRYGGSAIYVSSNQPYRRRNDISFSTANVESVWLEFDCNFLRSNSRSTVIGCVYRSPSSSYAEFCSELETILNTLACEDKNILLFGDTNINLLDPTDKSCSNYINSFVGHGLESLINAPTRCSTNGTETLIDHILSNLTIEQLSGVVNISITDHYPVFTLIESSSSRKFPTKQKQNIDKEKICCVNI